jgi:Lrp/AsnC family leucine-responsive transcriptional regulator
MDDIDRRILIALQSDGRQTNANLAKSVGLSPSAMLARVRRLENKGCIRGYRAIIDPQCLDLGLQAVIAIQARHSTNALATFERGIVGVQGVRACYRISGTYDYMLHVARRDLTQLGLMTKHKIAAIEGVGRIETMLVFTEVKSDEGWPIVTEELTD